MKYLGELDGLKSAVAACGLKGSWSENKACHRFEDKFGHIINWWPSTGTVQFQGTKKPGLEEALIEAFDNDDDIALPEVESGVHNDKRVFIVHGHDKVARDQLELLLYKLDLKPFVLQDNDGETSTIIEALEKQIYEGSSFGIVLMTPDDFGYSKKAGEDGTQPRARQNVILEMGMVMAALGRKNMAILKKGNLEIPSDCDGIIRLEFNEDVADVRDQLVKRLRTAGLIE